MQRAILLAISGLLVAGIFGVRPTPAQALPAILPDCDKTVLYVGAGCVGNPPVASPECVAMDSQTFYERFKTSDERKAAKPAIVTNRQCGFNDFVRLFTNLASYGLAVLGALGVAVIIWGGFDLILAMGNQEKVQEGKKTIWGGILGTFIVLVAFIMVRFFVDMLTGNTKGILFADTEYATYFAGERCTSYKDNCDKFKITYNATDDKMNNLQSHQGCRDNPKKPSIHNVTDLQNKLAALGCYNDDVDGCFGPNSLDAIMGFQSKNSIWPKSDPLAPGGFRTDGVGIADQETWDALDSAIAGTKYTGCHANLTAKVEIRLNVIAPGLYPPVVTVLPKGTVTWKNSITSPVSIQFDTPLKAGGSKPSFTINAGTEHSETFTEGGKYDYHVTGTPEGTPVPSGSIWVSVE